MRSPRAPAAYARPEAEVVLCCARTRLDAERAARISVLLQAEIDWTYLIATAFRHGVGPLLFWNLHNTCQEFVPDSWRTFLSDHFRLNGCRNLYLVGELCKILELFAARGILAIPYKGPVLAALAYGNLSLREFADLDIVVRQQDMAQAHELLVAEGYRSDFDLPAALQATFVQIPGQYYFERDDAKSIVELHTERTLRYFPVPLDLERLGQRLRPVCVGSREIRTFAPEDALSILCVHASKHFWERLMWICDIAELAQIPPGVDWERAHEQARRLGCERMLLLGLYLAHEVLEAPLPEQLVQRVEASSVVRSLAAQVQSRLLQEGRRIPGVAQRFFFRLRTAGNLWAGVRYCFRLATSPTEEDWSRIRLPGPLSMVYSALRPYRLIRKYGLGLVRRSEPSVAPAVPPAPRQDSAGTDAARVIPQASAAARSGSMRGRE